MSSSRSSRVALQSRLEKLKTMSLQPREPLAEELAEEVSVSPVRAPSPVAPRPVVEAPAIPPRTRPVRQPSPVVELPPRTRPVRQPSPQVAEPVAIPPRTKPVRQPSPVRAPSHVAVPPRTKPLRQPAPQVQEPVAVPPRTRPVRQPSPAVEAPAIPARTRPVRQPSPKVEEVTLTVSNVIPGISIPSTSIQRVRTPSPLPRQLPLSTIRNLATINTETALQDTEGVYAAGVRPVDLPKTSVAIPRRSPIVLPRSVSSVASTSGTPVASDILSEVGIDIVKLDESLLSGRKGYTVDELKSFIKAINALKIVDASGKYIVVKNGTRKAEYAGNIKEALGI